MNTDKSATTEAFTKRNANRKKDNQVATAKRDRRDARRKTVKLARKVEHLEGEVIRLRSEKSAALRDVQMLGAENSKLEVEVETLTATLAEQTEELAEVYAKKHDAEREAREWMLARGWWKRQAALLTCGVIGLFITLMGLIFKSNNG